MQVSCGWQKELELIFASVCQGMPVPISNGHTEHRVAKSGTFRLRDAKSNSQSVRCKSLKETKLCVSRTCSATHKMCHTEMLNFMDFLRVCAMTLLNVHQANRARRPATNKVSIFRTKNSQEEPEGYALEMKRSC